MKAVIMAGGLGTRVKNEFPDIPKSMIPLSGKPILQWQIELLKRYGIVDITLILGYRHEVIQRYFENGEMFNVHISYIVEDEPLGSGGALALLSQNDYLLLMGDLYLDVDISKLAEFHYNKNALISLCVHPNNHPQDGDIVVYDRETFRITDWSEKGRKKNSVVRNNVNAGVCIINQAVLPNEPAIKQNFEKDIVAPLIRSGRIFAYRTPEYVKDAGTPERILSVERDISQNIPQMRNLSLKQAAVFIDRDGTINEYDGFITLPEQIRLIDGAADAIKRLNESKYIVICVTNQPVVARGDITFDELERIHAKLESLLGEHGAYLDELLFCPHHTDKGFLKEVPELKFDCECRKPKPGMLFEAAQRFNIDLSKSYMVGDSDADMLCGKAAGCTTLRLKTGEGFHPAKRKAVSDFLCDDLLDAVSIIFGERG